MARKLKKDSWYVADFETTGEKFYNENGYTKVWLWACCDSNANIVKTGTDIESFIEWALYGESKIIYFHNLKFDGSFIVPWLNDNGFAFKQELEPTDNKNYSVLINDMGAWYNIKVKFKHRENGKQKKTTIEIRDSLKICPMKVQAMTKAFGLEVEKEHIDYDDYVVNETTISYVCHDVIVVAKALQFFYKMGFTQLTIGSDAFHDLKNFINNGYNIPRGNFGKNAVDYFGYLFPKLDRTWLQLWRKAYTGGRSQVNPKYANTIQYNINRYDINSMYPSIMNACRLPYGQPIEIKTRGIYAFELYHIRCSFYLKEGHLPSLLASKARTIYGGGEKYYVNQEEPIDLYISNIDFEIMQRHYDILDLEFFEMYGFRTSTKIFSKWVMKYYNLKAEMGKKGNIGLKTLYKLIINNIYGKFGSNCCGKSKVPFMDSGDILRFNLTDEQDMAIYYLPVAIGVTSYGHLMIDNQISDEKNDWKVHDGFIYCDTDSIHTLDTMDSQFVDNYEIGKFKLECTEKIGKYIRPKTYCHKDGDEWEITCAGMTPDIKRYLIDTYGDDVVNQFKIGLHIFELPQGYKPKLAHKQVKGGTILIPTEFTLQGD